MHCRGKQSSPHPPIHLKWVRMRTKPSQRVLKELKWTCSLTLQVICDFANRSSTQHASNMVFSSVPQLFERLVRLFKLHGVALERVEPVSLIVATAVACSCGTSCCCPVAAAQQQHCTISHEHRPNRLLLSAMAGRIPGVFISHLPADVDQRRLFEHFKRTWGLNVEGIKFMKQSDGYVAALIDLGSHGAAEQVKQATAMQQQLQRVLFQDAAVIAVVNLQPRHIDACTSRCQAARPLSADKQTLDKQRCSSCIFCQCT